MSSTLLSTPAASTGTLPDIQPSFLGIVKGEIFKASRQWSTWISLVLLCGAICFPYFVEVISGVHTRIVAGPLKFYYEMMEINLDVLRIFIGFFLIILTANIIGREYQLGTIRILLARGVGRMQLLAGKLVAVLLIAIVVGLICLILNVVLLCALIQVAMGNFDTFKVLNGDFWHNTWLFLSALPFSMLATILMTAAMCALGRTLVFGLSVGMVWFPADNLLAPILGLISELTKNTFWSNASAYLLGPNLNAMAGVFLPAKFSAGSIGQVPDVPVTGAHTIWVTLAYSLVFLVAAFVLTWQRDVKE